MSGAAVPEGGIRARPSDAPRLHPVLREFFADLERQAVRWSLLRMPAVPAAPTGDVDLLVDPPHVGALRLIAAAHGFVALPGWDSPPNLILASYDEPSDCWLVLDVFTGLVYNTPRDWVLTGGAAQVLHRRERRHGELPPLPAPGDAFWLLLLHCLLDKGGIPPRHRPRLAELAHAAPQSPLAGALWRAAGEAIDPAALARAAAAQQWAWLEQVGGRLGRELRRRRRLRERLKVAGGRARRALRKPLLLRRRRGVSLALLGPNGVGKSTAAAGLRRSFPFGSRVVYMGLWKGSDGAGAITRHVEPLLRPLRLWGRYAQAEYHMLRGRLVIFDRYVYEALLPARPPLLTLKRLYFGLLSRIVPSPAAGVVLDVPGAVAYGRKQENPPDELESERFLYGQIAQRVPCVCTIDASRSADEVRAAISTLVWQRLVERWERGNSA